MPSRPVQLLNIEQQTSSLPSHTPGFKTSRFFSRQSVRWSKNTENFHFCFCPNSLGVSGCNLCWTSLFAQSEFLRCQISAAGVPKELKDEWISLSMHFSLSVDYNSNKGLTWATDCLWIIALNSPWVPCQAEDVGVYFVRGDVEALKLKVVSWGLGFGKVRGVEMVRERQGGRLFKEVSNTLS